MNCEIQDESIKNSVKEITKNMNLPLKRKIYVYSFSHRPVSNIY